MLVFDFISYAVRTYGNDWRKRPDRGLTGNTSLNKRKVDKYGRSMQSVKDSYEKNKQIINKDLKK
jgi:hypothetical protein